MPSCRRTSPQRCSGAARLASFLLNAIPMRSHILEVSSPIARPNVRHIRGNPIAMLKETHSESPKATNHPSISRCTPCSRKSSSSSSPSASSLRFSSEMWELVTPKTFAVLPDEAMALPTDRKLYNSSHRERRNELLLNTNDESLPSSVTRLHLLDISADRLPRHLVAAQQTFRWLHQLEPVCHALARLHKKNRTR